MQTLKGSQKQDLLHGVDDVMFFIEMLTKKWAIFYFFFYTH